MLGDFGFSELFNGNGKAFGQWIPKNGSMVEGDVFMVKNPIKGDDYNNHLSGKKGLVIIPILEDNTCNFGAIDIDDRSIDLVALESKVRKLPLIVCRSKSGGAHLYLFVYKLDASHVRGILQRYAKQLGYKKPEIFPKQSRLEDGMVGNCINVPYFNAGDTNRYAIHNGVQLSLQQFCTLAIEKKEEFNKKYLTMAGAPPCLMDIYNEGVCEGSRNETLLNFAIYFKRSKSDWEDEINKLNYNADVFVEPLPKKEIDAMISSVSRKDYHYKCNQSPIKDYCNRDLCVMQEFGVKDDIEEQYGKIEFGLLTKILSDPPKWVLVVNGVGVGLNTEELMSYTLLRKSVLEKVNIMLPPCKGEDWFKVIKNKVAERKEVQAPEDASIGGQILSMLNEYLMMADSGDRDGLLRGTPVLLKEDGYDRVFFRGMDFVAFLKRRKAEEVKGANLWNILREGGCNHKKLRVGPTVIQTWYKDVDIKMLNVSYSNPMDGIKEEF